MILFIIFLLLTILLPACFLFLALTQKKSKDRFSFRSYFSYELFPPKESKLYYPLRVLEGLSLLTGILPGLYGLFAIQQFDLNYSLFFVGLSLAGIIAPLGQYFLSYIDLSFAKQHLSLFCVTGIGEILFCGMSGFYFAAVYRNLRDVFSLIVTIFLFLGLFASVLLLINPKLKDWAKLEKSVSEDGSVSYCRPKRFVLPYSEWVLYFVAILNNLIALIGLYFLTINR